MIRSAFVRRKVLELYDSMKSIEYPVRPETLLPFVPKNCRILSYRELANAAGCPVEEVALLCKSSSGATHLEQGADRFLILYNADMNPGRVRWTVTHEIGHVCLGHLEAMGDNEAAYTEQGGSVSQFESEADYFVWNLLAPLPIMREMGIGSAEEIRSVYGLSKQAAALQYDRYIKWCNGHYKTAWENSMVRSFRAKYVKP